MVSRNGSAGFRALRATRRSGLAAMMEVPREQWLVGAACAPGRPPRSEGRLTCGSDSKAVSYAEQRDSARMPGPNFPLTQATHCSRSASISRSHASTGFELAPVGDATHDRIYVVQAAKCILL